MDAGEAVALLGPAGSGKSTLLHMLCGLARPASGTCLVLGKDPSRDFPEIAARVGVLFQRPAFYEHLSVQRNLLAQARLLGRTVSVHRVLDWVGLVECVNDRPQELNREQRRRLALAHALLGEPELLLLDEPYLDLNDEAAARVTEIFRILRENAHVSILMATQRLGDVEAVCDRALAMAEGRLVGAGEVTTLLPFETGRVEVLLEGAESAAKRLADQPWVGRVEVRRDRLVVELPDGNAQQLIAFLLTTGHRLYGVLPQRRTLQDYLLKVMNQ